MDSKLSSRKANHDDDVDVDHYFLPGGILDTPSHEEDMIGGSLLDEIGGVGNVNVSVRDCHGRACAIPVPKPNLCSCQSHVIPFPLLVQLLPTVSRIVGPEARDDVSSTGVARLEPQGHRKAPGSVIRGGPT